MQDTRKITLPDLVSLCPFPLRPNPMYDQVRRESAAWIMSFNIFTGHKRDHFVVSDFEMLAAYAHPNAPYDRLRVCADLINHLATMDIMCDDLDGKAVRKVGDQVMAAFHGTPMGDGPVSRMSYELVKFSDILVDHFISYYYRLDSNKAGTASLQPTLVTCVATSNTIVYTSTDLHAKLNYEKLQHPSS